MPIAVEVNATPVAEQFTYQDKSFIHELQVIIVRPDVGVLRLLKHGVPLRLQSPRLPA